MQLTALSVFLLVLIGLASGFLSGMMGLGGGIIIIPALIYLLGFSQQEAQGTTLGLLVLPVGLLAAFQYYKAGVIDVKAVILIAIAFVGAGYFGAKMAITINQVLMRKIFSVVLVLIALKMFFQK